MMTATKDTAELLDPEMSLLAFQRRVLSLAQDATTPLLERLRFLGIVTSNIDELYMIRMAELRRAAVEETLQLAREGGSAPDSAGAAPMPAVLLLAAVEREVGEILAEQSRCAAECIRAAAEAGVRLIAWAELDGSQRSALRERYLDEIQPNLTPLAITLSPGYPLPYLPHLGLFVAVVFRNPGEDRAHLTEHELPRDVPRLLDVPGRDGALILIEEVLRANAHLLYPNAIVEGAHLFRVTRGGDLPMQEDDAADLIDAVVLATELRPHNPAVRVEVERSTPPHVGALILDSLRREAVDRDMELTVTEAQVVDGLLDLRCLSALPLHRPGDPDPSPFEFPPMVTRSPVPRGRSMFEAIRERDLLVHHPFDSFDDTVLRFLREAAHDPDVNSIMATLYRVGDPSPVVETLLAAAAAGKNVFALVELKARFDEEQNVQWARALERAGGQVVHGIAGLKVHLKAALVIRREGGRLARYVHVGSGNYNTRSGRQYTDLSLFSARDELTTDVSDLFGTLAGALRPPERLAHGALVAPHQLLPALLSRIDREAAHARAGRAAHIALKLNAIADTEVVRALYRASRAGVRIDLVVRGICTLRPGVPDWSATIRVFSVVGRFLEHLCIYRFANGGDPEYFVGSSDLRPRNLRRRVELLVPVPDPAHRARLDEILARYLEDATGWELTADGGYERRGWARPGAQATFAAEAAAGR